MSDMPIPHSISLETRLLRFLRHGWRRVFNSLKKTLLSRRGDIDRFLHLVMSVEGQISRSEAHRLVELAKCTLPERAIVEVGTYRGRSTIALAFGSLLGSANRVYAVDPHVEFQGVLGGGFDPRDQEELYRNLVRAGVGKIVAVVSLPSKAAARCWTERNIGLLWIDGDHSEAAVLEDYESWSPFISDEGILAFHDSSVPGVKKVLYELSQAKKIFPLGQTETLSWFRLIRD
jgi:predicted O-methyltransferase YrrM